MVKVCCAHQELSESARVRCRSFCSSSMPLARLRKLASTDAPLRLAVRLASSPNVTSRR